MPLGKLQPVGDQYDPFIYDLGWTTPLKQSQVQAEDFRGLLLLAPGAGSHLLRAAPLLRPFVQNAWAATVSRFNGLGRPDLGAFLFDAKRISLTPLSPGLREVARGRCSYCRKDVQDGHIDHFVAWARHNGIHNLVWAHDACNGAKSANPAAHEHLDRWLGWVADSDGELRALADAKHWESSISDTLSAARSTYLGRPSSYKPWVRSKHFEPVRIASLIASFAGTTGPTIALRHPAVTPARRVPRARS